MDKMNCNVIGDLLPLYADDVVSEDTKALVEEHLAECAECKETLNTIKNEIEKKYVRKLPQRNDRRYGRQKRN